MNICITGALGHVGSKLIRNLSIKSLNKIYLVDNFFTQRYASLFDLPCRSAKIKFYFYEMDILSTKMDFIIKDSDVVIHLAAFTDPGASFKEKKLVERINKRGLENVASLSAKYNCSLLFPSTTSVYGSKKSEVSEKCCELYTQNPYVQSKLYGEKLLFRLGKKKGLKFVVFRLGTIFGYSVGMRFHTAINKFIWQAVNGEEITVWKTAMGQKRPYCGLNDCVRAINFAVNSNIFDNQIYNIATVNLTVKDIIEVIKKYIPGVKVRKVEAKRMNELSYGVCVDKSIEKGFGYSDSLEKMIKETIEKLAGVNYKVKKKI